MNENEGKLFLDIHQGFSEARVGEVPAFVKHFNLQDQVGNQKYYQQQYDRAKSEGLPTDKERLTLLKEEGVWTFEDEDQISKDKNYLSGLNKTLSRLVIDSQIKQVKKTIEAAEKKLNEKLKEREGLLQSTCEKFASNKQNNYIIQKSFFKDSNLDKPYLSKEDFDELSNGDILVLLNIYNEATEHLEIEKIKRLALSPFFTNYFNLCGENPYEFFSGKVALWTFYQINLINHAKVFKTILDSISDIPEHIKEDPNALMEFANSKSKRDEYQERGQDKGGYSVMGATNQDMNKLGIQEKGGVNLHNYASQKGGKLNLQDFIDMQGD